MSNTQLYCPRCGGEMEKATYMDYYSYTFNNANRWYEKLFIIAIAVSGRRYTSGPGMLRCTHCNYYDENIPSSFHKPGSVMVPPVPKKVKNVNPILAIVVIGILSLFVIYLLFLSTLYK